MDLGYSELLNREAEMVRNNDGRCGCSWAPGIGLSSAPSAEPQVKPPPKASSSSSWPRWILPGAHGFVERQRHRTGRGIAVLVDGDDHAVHRHVEALGRRLDDAQVGLVRDQPVDRMRVDAVRGQRLFDDASRAS